MSKSTLFLFAALFSFVLGVPGLSRAEEAAKSPPSAVDSECPHMKKGEGGEKMDCPHMKGKTGDCPCKHEGAMKMKDCAKDCPHKAKGDCPCAKGGEAPADCPCHGKVDKAKGKAEKKPTAEKKQTVEKKEDAK